MSLYNFIVLRKINRQVEDRTTEARHLKSMRIYWFFYKNKTADLLKASGNPINITIIRGGHNFLNLYYFFIEKPPPGSSSKCFFKQFKIWVNHASAKSRGKVHARVAWVKFLRGLRELRGSKYFLRGLRGSRFFAWVNFF